MPNQLKLWEAIMLNRTKVVLAMLVIAMLATPWGMVGTAVAQRRQFRSRRIKWQSERMRSSGCCP